MAKKGKTIIITENDMNHIFESVITETYYPTAQKVLAIKQYLDDNFVRQQLDDFNEEGLPIKDNSVMVLNQEKQPIKTFTIKELLRLLDDKFHNFIKDDSDRRNFLKQVILDWFNNSITKAGLLSVNYV